MTKPKTESLPTLPKGFRFLTEEDRNSVRGMSSWLPVYPDILRRAIRWDNDFGWSAPGFRFFWEDQIYAVPERVRPLSKSKREYIEELEK